MFSGLSEYLFGSSSTSSSDATTVETPKREDDGMQVTDTEDDWVLVDVTNDSASPSPRRSPRKTTIKEVDFQSQPQAIPDKHHHMEESWFITPPPCFTAGGHSPHQLATSPMEDLLIEHPSMSVYHPSSRHGNASSRENRKLHLHRPKPNRTVARRTHNLRVRNTKPPRRAAAVAARFGIEQSSHSSTVQEQRETKQKQRSFLSRSKVERHNKSYHQQSASSHRHYRQNAAASGRHSGAIYKQPR